MNAAPTSGQTTPYRGYTYNLNGEPTRIEARSQAGTLTNDGLGWDSAGKLRQVTDLLTSTLRYTAGYDDGGARTSATVGGTGHTYSFGLYDTAGNTTYTPGAAQRKNGTDHFFHRDWIGSSRYLTDSTGNNAPTAYRFDGYGNLSAQAGPDVTSSKFAGGHGYESDAPLGLQLLGHRYYDPAVGRFLNPDPIGFAGGLNLYAYCENDPVGAVDPYGLDTLVIRGTTMAFPDVRTCGEQ